MENKNRILEKIRSDNSFGEYNSEELEKRLDRELAKQDPDYDLADELTAAILEARGKAVKEPDVQSELRTIKQKSIKHFKYPKWAITVSAACLVLIFADAVSAAARGTNIFSAFVQFTKGDLTIDFNKYEQEVISLPTSEDDPYGIKAKCAEYDIYPKTPYYLPEGFELVDFYADIKETFSDICFFYKNGKVKLNITYTKYADADNVPPLGIPTSTHNLQETEVNGQTMYILKEEKRFTAALLDHDTIYVIYADKLDYDECQTVIESFK